MQAPIDCSDQFVVEEEAEVRAEVRIAALQAKAAGEPAPGIESVKPGTDDAVLEEGEEIDDHKLAQRQKQIDYGKNTLGYQRYVHLVPREKRTKRDPQTPDIKQRLSKRCFDGQVKAWRRALHEYDNAQTAPKRGSGPRSSGAQRKDSRGQQQQGRQGRDRRDRRQSGLEEGEVGADGQLVPSGGDVNMRGNSDPGSDASQGSLEGYLPAGSKRSFPVGNSKGTLQDPGCTGEPQPKRSNASRSTMDTSLPPPVSCAGSEPAAPAAPTTFAGIAKRTVDVAKAVGYTSGAGFAGVGGKVQQGVVGEGQKQPEGAVGVRPAAGAKGSKDDNVLALILGGDNSCMSWQNAADE